MRFASPLRSLPALVAPVVALAFAGCQCGSSTKAVEPAASASSSPPTIASSAVAERPRLPPPVRQGGALARSVTGDSLYLADEDHGVVRMIPLPLDARTPAIEVKLPGRPASVLPLDGRVLVTIRDPGLLLILRPDAAAGLVEAGRVALPADAWGMAITPDEKTVIVTSAWTHQVSAVDLEKASKRWSIDVAREPRGVAITADGQRGYVSHLVGSALTRLDDLAGHGAAKAIALPPSPLRTPDKITLGASLGYTVVLSPDDRRLFAPRHALGALGSVGFSDTTWFGASTVDVLLPTTDAPLCPKRSGPASGRNALLGPIDEVPLLSSDANALIQPRAAVYRATRRTLLVAGEGNATLAEVDGLAIDPMAIPRRVMHLEAGEKAAKETCLAPSGLALSTDETRAFVYCRAKGDIVSVELDKYSIEPDWMKLVHLADDAVGPDVLEGRKLFYEGNDPLLSGGLACAGCHPEGRDDGFVWSEGLNPENERIFTGGPHMILQEGLPAPRQTPMLAGRVFAAGPYGWHGQNKDLVARVIEGAGLHRWRDTRSKDDAKALPLRAGALAIFLRKGLVPPPREAHEPTTAEARGKELFFSAAVGCASCHPASEYTDRAPIVLRATPPPPGFVEEEDRNFKTPSLLFVAGTPPYFHDGSAPTLEALIAGNDDRMGKTKQLSREDQAALVAFLKTL